MKNAFKNKYLYIFLSVVFSLCLHLFLFLMLLKFVEIPTMLDTPPSPKRKMNVYTIVPDRKKIKQAPVFKPEQEPIPELEDVQTEPPLPALDNESEKNLADENTSKGIPIDLPKMDVKLELPEIVVADTKPSQPDTINSDRFLIPVLPRSEDATLTNITAPDDSIDGGSALPKVTMTVNLPVPEMPPIAPPDSPVLPQEPPAIPMDPFLDVKIYKYPLPHGGGYFRIDLTPNKKSSAMHNFSKDVIYLVDISGSIGRRSLNEFKYGLVKSIVQLNKSDRMDIAAFSSVVRPLSRSLFPPTAVNLRKAKDFIFTFSHGGTTNIYSAVAPFVNLKGRTLSRPLIIFLLSDGQVNTGQVVGSRNLINKVSNENRYGAAIYTFSCGDDRNSFLMDLLAYRNRGESLNIENIAGSGKALATFMSAVSNVKVINLDYQISSNLAAAVFPKRLPNLYAGKTLSVYGQYYKDTDSLGLRITGTDSSGKHREIVFKGTLADAEISDISLPRKWAEQYIYHLYSRLSCKYDENITKEIHSIANRFKLKLPYLDKHLVPRRRSYVR